MTTPPSTRLWTADPFFEQPFGPEWNALIGDQGDAENYVDGYIEAALELTEAVLIKKQYDKRDTLILPILYNIRHGVELTLKFVINTLVEIGCNITARPPDHNIAEDYKLLVATNSGDELLNKTIRDLDQFVSSLAAIDDDGQMLRYAKTQDGNPSLAGRSHANLLLVHASIKELAVLLSFLRRRALEMKNERLTGSFTQDCSRYDLSEIAKMLPPRTEWAQESLTTAKQAVKTRYGIGSNKLSDAIKIIEKHREFGQSIGITFDLVHLTDGHAIFVVEQWLKTYSPPSGEITNITEYIENNYAKIQEDSRVRNGVVEQIHKTISPSEIADLETIFYTGRDSIPVEYYERRVKVTQARVEREDPKRVIAHLVEKTSLAMFLAVGIEKLGRPDLAGRIRGMCPNEALGLARA